MAKYQERRKPRLKLILIFALMPIASVHAGKVSPINNPKIQPAYQQALSDLITLHPDIKINILGGVQPTSWGDYDFSLQGKNTHTEFIALTPLGDDGRLLTCHACAPKIASVTYQERGGKWINVTTNPSIGSFGAWGKPPRAELSVRQMLNDTPALFLSTSAMGQGYSTVSADILAYSNGWKSIGNVKISEDNLGSFECANSHFCWYWHTNGIDLTTKDNNGLPDLIARRFGTMADANNNLIAANSVTYQFSGERYIPGHDMNNAALTPVPKNDGPHPESSAISLADLHRMVNTGMEVRRAYQVNAAITGNNAIADNLCESVRPYDGYCDIGARSVPISQDALSTTERKNLYDLRRTTGQRICATVEMSSNGELLITAFSEGTCR